MLVDIILFIAVKKTVSGLNCLGTTSHSLVPFCRHLILSFRNILLPLNCQQVGTQHYHNSPKTNGSHLRKITMFIHIRTYTKATKVVKLKKLTHSELLKYDCRLGGKGKHQNFVNMSKIFQFFMQMWCNL